MAVLCLWNRFPMTATYNPRPSQSSPYPTTWIQDGGCVCGTGSHRYLQSAPLPVQSHTNPRGSKMAAVFAKPVLCLTAQLPLQLCSHHAPVLFLSVIIALILNLEWKRTRIYLLINILEAFRIRFRWIRN